MAEQQKGHPEHANIPPGLESVKHVIAIASGKGGVGKSTVAVNFALALLKSGASVGLLDADIYGPSQPLMLGAEKNRQPEIMGDFILPMHKQGLSFMSMGVLLDDNRPVIWRAPLATKMIHQFLGNVLWGELDFLIIDLPPGTGDVQITLAQQAALTGAIIVTTPQQAALGVARKGLQMFEHVNVPILGIIENMSGFTCPHCGENTPIFKTGGGEKLAEELGINFLGNIPLDPELMNSSDDGVPLLVRDPETPAAKAFIEAARRFQTIISQSDLSTVDEPKSMDVVDKGDLQITWPDGLSNRFTAYELRVNCPCAMCVDENTGQRTLDPKKVPLNVQIKSFGRVGRYAVNFNFSDGHNTGIYSFDIFREMSRKKADSSGQAFSV